MAINAGNKVLIKVSKTPITTFVLATGATKVGNLGSFDNSVDKATIETTSFGDTYEKFISGIKTGSMSLSGVINNSDLGQKILVEDFDGDGDGVYLAVWENEKDTYCMVYHVFVSKFSKKAEVNGKQELSLEFKLMEAPIKVSQA